MCVEVLQSGLYTTIQDLGRHGYQQQGVSVSGPMDKIALRLANLLVGNKETEAVMETTLNGPKLLFHETKLIAISGGDFSPTINGEPVPTGRPVLIRKGSILNMGSARKGCRAYIALAGGIDVPKVLASRSTYVRAKIGGYKGRPLKKGDSILTLQPTLLNSLLEKQLLNQLETQRFLSTEWLIGENVIPLYKNKIIRVIRGQQFEKFTGLSKNLFFQQSFIISSQSDRMGYRLSGEPLELSLPLEMISEGVSMGTIQVPPDGQPIILMADRQTTGGYPKIGYIASVDLPLLAQCKPGEKIRFQEITLREAQLELKKKEKMIQTVKIGIELMIKK
ncbi:KipI antagonist [Heyndrickxia sporothermodurans]|nr:KipI antagonist [Heyndrickxia sporothermodurans]